jgi:hypothetical protein
MEDGPVRTVVGCLVVGIVLAAGGELFRRTATFEDALSADQEHLTTGNAADTSLAADEARTPQVIASLPIVGPRISTGEGTTRR